jgi:hypothetical protein
MITFSACAHNEKMLFFGGCALFCRIGQILTFVPLLSGVFLSALGADLKQAPETASLSVYGMGPLLEDLVSPWGDNPQRVLSMGAEPIVGRQVCPSLTRLNLSQGRSELVLLSQLFETDDDSRAKGFKWTLALKQGITWWGGDPVSLAEFQSFIEQTIPEAVKNEGKMRWDIPLYTVQKTNLQTIEILWESKPKFGPYILNGFSLVRVHPQKMTRECVGLYRPEVKPWGLQLSPTPGYSFARPLPQVNLYYGLPEETAAGLSPSQVRLPPRGQKGWIEYGGIWNRKDYGKCQVELEEPFMTVLVWNQQNPLIKDRNLRKILAQLIPKKSIAGIMGNQYVSADESIVPKGHPFRFYQETVQVQAPSQKFESVLSQLSAELTQAGYARTDPKGPRVSKSGEPLELTFFTRSSKQGLIEKVLADVFSSVGVKVTYRNHKELEGAPSSEFHGTLETVAIDWPGVNLWDDFHSKSNKSGPFAHILKSDDLDRALENAAFDLTLKSPNFKDFKTVQQIFQNEEAITVLLQHKSCLTLAQNMIGNREAIANRNPDWFRQLILIQ